MSAVPRVIITQFDTVEHAGFAEWVSFQQLLLGSRRAISGTSSDRTVWQLMSGNNRVLARSASIHPTIEDARDDAAHLISALDRVVIVPVSMGRRAMQAWYLSLDGRPELIGARVYVADRERIEAAELAVASLASAVIKDAARVSVGRVTGARK